MDSIRVRLHLDEWQMRWVDTQSRMRICISVNGQVLYIIGRFGSKNAKAASEKELSQLRLRIILNSLTLLAPPPSANSSGPRLTFTFKSTHTCFLLSRARSHDIKILHSS